MTPLVWGILVSGIVTLGASVALFFAYRFERFVGLRYLLRGRGSRAAKAGLLVATIAVVVGVSAVFAGGRGQSRDLETMGVVLTLFGALAVMLFLLLRVFAVFTTVSTMGVVLGVASLVVVLAVTSGFEKEFQDKVLAVNAHLIVMKYGDSGLAQSQLESDKEADDIKKKLAGFPGLSSMAKFSLSAGEVMIGKVGANLKGVDLPDGAADLKRTMVEGSVEALTAPATCVVEGPGAPEAGASAKRIILGVELAHRLRAKVGQCVSVLVPFTGTADTAPISYLFKVVGTFQMGFHEYDTRLAYVSLADARSLGNARQSIFGIELRFVDPMMAMTAETEVTRRLGNDLKIVDWKTLNRNLFMALTMQKLIIALFLVLIIVVAAFNIVASLTLIVLNKVREIAILRSMGARSLSLVRVFLVAGSFVGFVGTGLGVLFGLLVCSLARAYGYPLDPKVYLIAQLPVAISWHELVFVAASTQLICFLATIYPAVRAARLPVIEGLRYN